MRATCPVWYLLILVSAASAAAAATVSVDDFQVAPDQIDATVAKLAAMPFGDVAPPAATILGQKTPVGFSRDPRWSDAEFEVKLRQLETPAESVARLVWRAHVRRAAEGAAGPAVTDPTVSAILCEIATDRTANVDMRRIVIGARGLGLDYLGSGTLSDAQRLTLYRVANDTNDDPELRKLAALSLVWEWRRDDGDDRLWRCIEEIIRAQPTLAKQHSAFNDLTNLGMRLWQLPHGRFVALVRLGFELIERTDERTDERTVAAGYFTATRLGRMLKQPMDFAPPHDGFREADGNLGKKFHARTVQNAGRWWNESGRRAMDTIAPPR